MNSALQEAPKLTTKTNHESPRVVLPSLELLPKWAREHVNNTKAPTFEDHGSSLRIIWAMLPENDSTPNYVRDHEWELALLFHQDHRVSSAVDGQAPESNYVPRVHEPVPAMPKLAETSEEVEEPEQAVKGVLDESRMRAPPTAPRGYRFLDLLDARRDPLLGHASDQQAQGARQASPHDVESNRPRGPPRKAVCQHCWETGRTCDSHGQCGSCRSLKIKYIRKLCTSGPGCLNPRCFRLHPGDWDPSDPEWIVEEGILGRKNSAIGSRPFGDYYRP